MKPIIVFKSTPRYIESSTCAYLFVSYIMGLGWHAISTLLERRPTAVEVKFSQTGVPPHNVSFALITGGVLFFDLCFFLVTCFFFGGWCGGGVGAGVGWRPSL